MIQSELTGQSPEGSSRGAALTEIEQIDSQESNNITSDGGEARGSAPAQRESAGSPYSGACDSNPKTFTEEELDKWLNPDPAAIHYYDVVLPRPTDEDFDKDWQRLEQCQRLVVSGQLEAWQYNLLVERLGFSDFLKIDSQDVEYMRRRLTQRGTANE